MEKNKKPGMLFEIFLLILFVALFPFVKKDILIFAFYTVVYFYIIVLKKGSIEYLGLSTLIAIIWVTLARNFYVYGPDMATIFGLSVYPLLAWALGLLGMREIYSYLRPKNTLLSIVLIAVIYVVVLVSLESFSYNIVGFRLSTLDKYPGLPLCNCIHVPLPMQIYYLTIGPIYYMLTLLLDKLMKRSAGPQHV